jgi:hypothetical protein
VSGSACGGNERRGVPYRRPWSWPCRWRLAEAAEATLPAEASVSDGSGGERARGVWGKAGRALPAAVGGYVSGRLRHYAGTTQRSQPSYALPPRQGHVRSFRFPPAPATMTTHTQTGRHTYGVNEVSKPKRSTRIRAVHERHAHDTTTPVRNKVTWAEHPAAPPLNMQSIDISPS